MRLRSLAGRMAVVATVVLATAPPHAPAADAEREGPAFAGAGSLPFVTNLAFSPDGRMFFTEKETGKIRVVQDGRLLPTPFATLDVVPSGESGLLGLALDPDFPKRPWVYVYYTAAADPAFFFDRARDAHRNNRRSIDGTGLAADDRDLKPARGFFDSSIEPLRKRIALARVRKNRTHDGAVIHPQTTSARNKSEIHIGQEWIGA